MQYGEDVKFVFEADMKKGECFHCPCHYVDIADNDRCGIDRAMTFSVVDEVDCPLEEFKERRKPMKVYGHRFS